MRDLTKIALPVRIVMLMSLVVAASQQAIALTQDNAQPTSPVVISLPAVGDMESIVIAGAQVPSLIGMDTSQIHVRAISDGKMLDITSQIDAKDSEGKYVLAEADTTDDEAKTLLLDENAELVFMASDAGIRASEPPKGHLEIEIQERGDTGKQYVYIGPGEDNRTTAPASYVSYDSASDSISTDIYRLGFSSTIPFLVDSMEWKLRHNGGWSPNVVDTMKIKHTGRLFGTIPFKRTQGDYVSKIVAVKKGPVRVIRRTSNRIHLFWMLKSPEVLIDYIAYRSGFDMDVVIDIPFRIGTFFKEVETIPSIDWSDAAALPPLTVRTASLQQGAPVNGSMSEQKRQINESSDTALEINSRYGSISVQLFLEDGSPILKKAYFQDDKTVLEPPEQYPGQFGEVGFRTYNWEKLETQVSHMFFHASFSQSDSIPSLADK